MGVSWATCRVTKVAPFDLALGDTGHRTSPRTPSSGSSRSPRRTSTSA